jgi:alpha-methylacyl-CoA racemase
MKDLLDVELPDRNDLNEWPALRKVLAETFGQRTQAEWVAIFDGTDACVQPVVPLIEAYEHPHNVARGTYVERDGLTQPAPAPRFSATPATLTTTPSRPGADTRAALTAWGIDGVDALIADGVAVQLDTEEGTA